MEVLKHAAGGVALAVIIISCAEEAGGKKRPMSANTALFLLFLGAIAGASLR